MPSSENKIDFTKKSKFSNLSSEERKAWISLRKRDDIVIKPPDKGGAVVVWLRQLYFDEGMKQLSDQRFTRSLVVTRLMTTNNS